MTRAKPLLQVIVGSTRPVRIGKPIADWFAEEAWADQRFNIKMVENSIDYLHNEWAYKALGFVSYRGVAAGTRAEPLSR